MQKVKSSFLSFFGVRREESETVGMFFLHHFFLGLGQAMFFIAAISKFLEKLTPEYLAQVFVLSAIVLMAVGRIYAHYEHYLPFKVLLPKVVLFLIGLTVAFRFAFYFIHDDILLLILLEIAFFIVYLLSNLEFWGLSALVFDVRQGKRLFSLISAGDVPAKMLGYLCVALFTPHEKDNLLIIAALAFTISYFILKNLLPKVDVGHHHHHVDDDLHTASGYQNPKTKIQSLKDFFGNRFILNLSILSFLYYAVFIMIEFMFYCKVKEHTQVQTDSPIIEQELAHWLGRFLSISYAVIFILKLSYSGKLLNRIGVKRALLTMPIVLGALSFIYFFYGSAENNNANIFFIGIMAITAFVLKYALNDPTFLVLFQPMSARFRLQGHTVIKAFVQSVALAVTGLTLWASYVYWGEKVNFFYYLNYEIFIFIAGWMALVFVCYKNYIAVLNEAIKKRFITGAELAFNDDTYLSILKEKLNSSIPEETLFAMNTLDNLEPLSIKTKIPDFLSSTHTGILNKSIELIANHRWSAFLPNLYDKLSALNFEPLALSYEFSEPDKLKMASDSSKFKVQSSKLIHACCTLDDDAYDKLEMYFDEKHSALHKSLIVGFINSDDLNARIQVQQILLCLIESDKKQDKILACDIIGALKNPSLQKPLQTLIKDTDDKVCIAAIKAAGEIKAVKLLPILFDRMRISRFKQHAINSLGMFGNKLDIEHWWSVSQLVQDQQTNQQTNKLTNQQTNQPTNIIDFIKIAEKTGGKTVEKFLVEQLQTENGKTKSVNENIPIRNTAVVALNVLNYRHTTSEKQIFTQLLGTEFSHTHTLLVALSREELTISSKKLALSRELPDISSSQLTAGHNSLLKALSHELELCIARIFQIFRLLYPTDTIKKAESAVYLAEKEKKANALEMLDNIIPKRVYEDISVLLENVPADAKVLQLKKHHTPIEPENFTLYVIQQGEKKFTKWTVSVALRELAVTSDSFENYSFYLNNRTQLLRQSSFEAINHFKTTQPENYKSIANNKIEEMMKHYHHEQRLTDIEKVFVLKSTQLFSDTPENIIAEIVPIVKEVAISKGDIIFNKGDNGSSMYIIYEGIVKIHDGDNTFIENKNRDFFGELALLDPEPRSASATAVTDTLLLKLEEEEWYELMEGRPEVLRSIMRILCRRIRHQNELLIGK